MKKKLVVVLALVLLSASLVTAGLVKYLSNTINAEVDISSPIYIEFEDTGTETKTFNVFGGETVAYTTLATNRANVGVDVYKVVHQITSPVEWAGTEFSSINLVDRGTNVGDVLPYLCYVKADGTLIPFSSIAGEHVTTAKVIVEPGCGVPSKYAHPSGSVIDNDISIVLNPAIMPGDYTIKLCHLYDLTGSC